MPRGFPWSTRTPLVSARSVGSCGASASTSTRMPHAFTNGCGCRAGRWSRARLSPQCGSGSCSDSSDNLIGWSGTRPAAASRYSSFRRIARLHCSLPSSCRLLSATMRLAARRSRWCPSVVTTRPPCGRSRSKTSTHTFSSKPLFSPFSYKRADLFPTSILPNASTCLRAAVSNSTTGQPGRCTAMASISDSSRMHCGCCSGPCSFSPSEMGGSLSRQSVTWPTRLYMICRRLALSSVTLSKYFGHAVCTASAMAK
eukprot:365567-Chlamydomonas_euryale.AAC.5